MKSILLTGFEPFGGDTLNPSMELIKQLEGKFIEGAVIKTTLLPVDYTQVGTELVKAIETVEPEIILNLGVANGRPAFSVERIAVNVLDFSMPDNKRNQPVDEPIIPNGPTAYFSTLPIKTILSAVKEMKVPAVISNSAGTYICNQVMYLTLHFLAEHRLPTCAGLIHLPYLPEQIAGLGKAKPSMCRDHMLVGVETAIRTTLQYLEATKLNIRTGD